ncbi:alpha/beta hydrolase fold [Streptomyces zhaozhouensis]|uniref:Alpha/beta hydrolase fold n=1 Tax=Streptomyces zhaozhouensis TaxID=1300267 RepID=A0A286DZT5_9ACTN|nr:alpha/beta hydrolase [Streptomyces zhaozhouensis]SOD64130.1 alpha/beta hydrolase fold [Streptomyces zhaozhouensis]
MLTRTRNRPSRRARAGLAATALLLPLAACSSQAGQDGEADDGARPPGLEEFHAQELAWESCAGYANTADESTVYELVEGLECALLRVPLDHEDPGGETLRLAVNRVPARGEAIGSLVTNPGGPGGSGLFGAATTSLALAETPVTERFDVVGFDPRGVGSSQPAVDCYSDAEADTGDVPLSSQGNTVQWTEEDTRDLMERCAEGSGGIEVLTRVGSREVARDMDILRAVLGDEKLNFLGQSYGTRLGAVYAEQFPRHVRAMVLDGAIDPVQGTFERRIGAYAGFQAAFERMAADCAERGGCPLGDVPGRATEVFQEIVRPLFDAPVPALDQRLTFDGAVGGVIAGLYSEESWPLITDGIAELREGRGDILLQLSRDFAGRDDQGAWPNLSEANYAVNCADEERLTPEQGAALRTAALESAPFTDPGVDVTDGVRDSCEHWPVEPGLGFPYAQDIEGLPETLVVSITGDPTTPHQGGVNLAESLGGSLLTVEGEGHTVVGSGANACVNEAVAAYLVDLTAPGEGATCTR